MEMMDFARLRIGSGFDLHALSEDPSRRFVLGGIEVAPGNGPIGHSDADVVCHALADALLGSVGLGGIGDHFLDSDPAWSGADSINLLVRCRALFEAQGFRLINGDATIVLQVPKLAGYRNAMEAKLTEVLGAPISVKAKSPESIGPLGASQAVVCMASILAFSTKA